MLSDTYVSAGSVTSYATKSGKRWRWQAVAAIQSGNVKSKTAPVGEAGFHTRREAEQARDEARHQLRKHGFSPKEPLEVIPTVKEIGEMWLESLDLAAATVSGYRKNVRNHLYPYLGHKAVDEVSLADLNELYAGLFARGRKDSKDLGGALKSKTVFAIHLNVRQLFDFARRHGKVPFNIAEHEALQAPSSSGVRGQAEEVEVWTVEEVRSVLDWNEFVDKDDLSALWRLMSTTGIRRGEGIAVHWKDFDFQKSQLSVQRSADSARSKKTKPTKTYTRRPIDLSEETIICLQAYRAQRALLGAKFVAPSSFVFGTDENELRGPNDVTRRWSKMVRRAQRAFGDRVLPWVTLKGLRHSHATHLLQLGVHPKIVQERLGHSNIQTTLNVYSHVLPTMQAEAVKALEAAWRKSDSGKRT